MDEFVVDVKKTKNEIRENKKSYNMVVAILSVVLFVLILSTLIWGHRFSWGKSTIIQGMNTYRELDERGIYSLLAVFSASDIL